jgi:GH24 family phage-related lysozyme (muramidase)
MQTPMRVAPPRVLAWRSAMKTSAAGQAFIASHEGIVLTAYPDPGTGGAPWTIGIGHTSAAGPPRVSKGMAITREDAFAILAADLATFEAAVTRAVPVALTQTEFDALVSLCFNIGPANFARSTLVRRLKQGERAGAAAAFLSWTKAAGRVLPGLVTRREDERRLFLTGAYTPPATARAKAKA